jgi:hypothetical protein
MLLAKRSLAGLRREALFGDQVDLFRRPSQPETDASHCARLAKSRHSTIREMVAHHRFRLGSPAAR